MPKLSDLVAHLPNLIAYSGGDTVIEGIAFDSRQLKPGDLFVAARGLHQDGHKFISDAIAAGASAVAGSDDLTLPVPYVRVADGRTALAYLAAAFYDFPARKLRMIGVTGTDGKTTTANLLYEILKAAGINAGMISTVNAVIGRQVLDTGFHVTTPEAPDVQKYLAMMVKAGLTHAVLETTSHGLEQKRVDACAFDIGVVTNITHEHLNDHGSLENYRLAKSRLFSGLAETREKPWGNPRLSVLNRDDWSYGYLQPFVPGPQVSYGLTGEADIFADDILIDPAGLHFTVAGTMEGREFRTSVSSRLVGAFNVSNCLAAFSAAVVGLGIDRDTAAAGIGALDGIPGRMERIHLGQDFTSVVDFAHTPNALLSALKTARRLTEGRVICVFGSAGLRDREKRTMMAETSAELADVTILTAEDPRTESLDEILAEMATAVESKGGVEEETFWRVPDRGEAIRYGINLAEPGDLLIACGKGHEQSMCFGSTEYAWDDRTAMRAALAEFLEIEGPEMPYLPTREGQQDST